MENRADILTNPKSNGNVYNFFKNARNARKYILENTGKFYFCCWFILKILLLLTDVRFLTGNFQIKWISVFQRFSIEFIIQKLCAVYISS
jgi:hypothetical protein